MVELKNCGECGRLFGYDGENELCKKCRNEEENEFKKVKEYLWKHPNSSIDEVHEETKVKKETIIKFLKEGRLAAEGLDISLELSCERCGTSITKGRYCYDCQQKIINGFKEIGRENKKEKSAQEKMFIQDRIKEKKEKSE